MINQVILKLNAHIKEIVTKQGKLSKSIGAIVVDLEGNF